MPSFHCHWNCVQKVCLCFFPYRVLSTKNWLLRSKGTEEPGLSSMNAKSDGVYEEVKADIWGL